MKYTYTTPSTTFTTKGWKKDSNGMIYKSNKDTKPNFQKEIDQTLFSKEMKVEDLPKDTWFYGACDCPCDLIKTNINSAIRRLVHVLDDAQHCEATNTRVTFDINFINEVIDELKNTLGIAILYNRYNTKHSDFLNGSLEGSKLVSALKTELIESLANYGVSV